MAHKKKQPVEKLCQFGDFRMPILEIPIEHGPPLTIGSRSGRAILEYLDAIREFVTRHEITRYAIEQMCDRPAEWE